MGWNAQPTRAGDIRQLSACRSQTGSARKAPASRSPWPASTAGGSTSRPVRSAARSRRWTRTLAYMQRAQGLRQKAERSSRRCSSVLADMDDRAAGRAHIACTRAAASSTARTPTRRKRCAMAEALRHRCRLRGRQSGAAAPSAATAICPNTASRRSCAIFACTRSSKAPTKSCAPIMARGLDRPLRQQRIRRTDHDDDCIHRPRQHGQPDGGQPGQGRARGVRASTSLPASC